MLKINRAAPDLLAPAAPARTANRPCNGAAMTALSPETLQALAEALAPPTKQLAAGLLRRPLPGAEAPVASIEALAINLSELLAEALPALRDALADMAEAGPDDAEDIAEALAGPLFALVEGARNLHRARLAPEAEPLRPYLAAIAEDAPADAVELFLHVIQAALNPWEMFEDPEHPELDLSLKPDAPAHFEALKKACNDGAGPISEDVLKRLQTALSADSNDKSIAAQ